MKRIRKTQRLYAGSIRAGQTLCLLLHRGISFSTGTLKQGQAGRAESEGKETDNDEKEQGIIGQQGQVQGRTAHLKVTGRAEGDEDAENKNQDVHRQKISSRNTRVGKKEAAMKNMPMHTAVIRAVRKRPETLKSTIISNRV